MPVLDPQLLDRQQLPKSRATVAARQTRQQMGEVLLGRSVHLPREAQMLLELVYRGGLSQRRIGALLGVPHGTVGRRLKRIATTLRDPMVVRLIDGPCPIDRTDREMAIGYFAQKRTLKDLAAERGLSITQVSRRLQYVRGWYRGASLPRPTSR